MNLTEDREKLKNWIKNNCVQNNNILCEPNEKVNYWNEYEQGRDIEEYDFQTVKELKQLFLKRMNIDTVDDELIRILVVSVFKSKPRQEYNELYIEGNKIKNDIRIPEFVYTF